MQVQRRQEHGRLRGAGDRQRQHRDHRAGDAGVVRRLGAGQAREAALAEVGPVLVAGFASGVAQPRGDVLIAAIQERKKFLSAITVLWIMYAKYARRKLFS